MVIAGVIVLIKAVCLFIIQKDLGIATVKENENKTLFPVSQREPLTTVLKKEEFSSTFSSNLVCYQLSQC